MEWARKRIPGEGSSKCKGSLGEFARYTWGCNKTKQTFLYSSSDLFLL